MQTADSIYAPIVPVSAMMQAPATPRPQQPTVSPQSIDPYYHGR
jgi:hypothetical protein